MLDSVVSGMSRSIIGTLAGDIQVYSSKSKDDLALFGNMGGTDPNLEQIDEFEKIRKTVEKPCPTSPGGADGHQRRAGDLGQHHRSWCWSELRAAVRKKLAGDATQRSSPRRSSRRRTTSSRS
jgi:hypothetical protein